MLWHTSTGFLVRGGTELVSITLTSWHVLNCSDEGATVQVLLFAQLAAKLKLNAPNAHTWLEIIGARWGNLAHKVFLFFGQVLPIAILNVLLRFARLATNIIVSSMLLLGGSATVTDLTGMNTIAVFSSPNLLVVD